MQREWEPEDLVAAWTLLDDDWALVANKTGHSRLGFALLLKFFEAEARFPRHAGELPSAAVDYVAAQVKVGADQLAKYAWSGRTIEYHRSQVRNALRFREQPAPARRRSPHGWARRSPLTRFPRTGCGRRCWPAADPSTSSHPAASSGSSARPVPRTATGSVPPPPPGSALRRPAVWSNS